MQNHWEKLEDEGVTISEISGDDDEDVARALVRGKAAHRDNYSLEATISLAPMDYQEAEEEISQVDYDQADKKPSVAVFFEQ